MHAQHDSSQLFRLDMLSGTGTSPERASHARFAELLRDHARRQALGRRSTILVVDDEPDSLQMLDVLFAQEGMRVLHASSGAEALAVISWLYERSFMKPTDLDELVAAAHELLSKPS